MITINLSGSSQCCSRLSVHIRSIGMRNVCVYILAYVGIRREKRERETMISKQRVVSLLPLPQQKIPHRFCSPRWILSRFFSL